MTIHIYNSLTKRKEEFVPIDTKKKTINMYTCGVTVYDKCHLGHARSLFIFNVIRNYLAFRGYDVHFVRNITDVDDKIIQKANELKKSTKQVAEENIKVYQEDIKRLYLDEADIEPKATDNIDSMIKHIQSLINKDYAYESEGDVYFSVRKFEGYGKLSKQSIEQMQEAVRIEKGEKKMDPLDFALWKKSKDSEPAWESPWSAGRPGWHIECSVMSLKHLGCETLDIHAGGRDLIFPHHENEIAQSEALTGKPFAKYWIHHGLLTINNQKMAKSLGNFITIEDAVREYDVDDLKFFFLSSHYASPIDFSKEKMAEAHKAMQRFDVLFWKAAEIIKDKEILPLKADFIEEARGDFVAAMDDDFNTPKALAALFNLLNDINKFIDTHKKSGDYDGIVYHAVDTIEQLAKKIFGLFSDGAQKEISPEEELLLKERIEARLKKNFKRSDELRDLLKDKGIVVEDTKEGQVWRWA